MPVDRRGDGRDDFAARDRVQLDDAVPSHDPGAPHDPGCGECLLRNAQPAAASDHDRLLAVALFLAHAPVAQVDDPVGDARRLRIVAHDHRGRPLLGDELVEDRVHTCGRGSVELAGGLVGDEQPRAVRERGAQRDPLLLAARELPRSCGSTVEQSDPLEQLAGASSPLPELDREQAEGNPDQLLGGQLAGERPPVVLVRVAEGPAAVSREPSGRRVHEVEAVDDHRARGRSLEAGEDPHERRLSRAARTEDDARLPLLDRKGETAQRSYPTSRRRVHDEQLPRLDERGHLDALP